MTRALYGIGLAMSMTALSCGATRLGESLAIEHTTGDAAEEPGWMRESRLGGATTVINYTPLAYTLPAANLQAAGRDRFAEAQRIFIAAWTVGAAGGEFTGLGPLFNQSSCAACHAHDGRGTPPGDAVDEDATAVIRLSVGGHAPATTAHPVYGWQLNHRAVAGFKPEGRVQVTWVETTHELAGGTEYTLRAPVLDFNALTFGPPGDGVMASMRIPPALIGLGLLEAVPEAHLRALADPADRDGDGVSGRLAMVWDPIRQRRAPGRFGWKASRASLRHQNAAALLEDMGITTPHFREESATSAHGTIIKYARAEPEMASAMLDLLEFYTRALAVPARAMVEVEDGRVHEGARLFAAAGCTACHVPSLTTAHDAVLPELAGQVIYPYTDLLLHDMGQGLADGRPDGDAGPTEWRTPALWGIGLSKLVNAQTHFLHDGRARDLFEAIMWHGGEASASRDMVYSMPRSSRDSLIAFLESL